MYKKTHHIHFVGIGGIGMSGIAELLINLGYRVSGSDSRSSEITKRLAALGAGIAYRHTGRNLKDADVVVVSSAIKNDNPEIVFAQEHNIPVIPRAEMLGELMRLKYGIAVAGAHGKTTTTSLIAAILDHGGIDPTVVIGGKLNKTNTTAALGSGDFLVAEADESDGSFLKLPPTIAVVTNIDREHMDFYAGMDDIKEAFFLFLDKVPFYGLCVMCLDDENLQSLIPRIKKRMVTYGCASQADLQARNIRLKGLSVQFSVHFHDKNRGVVTLPLSGIHNVYNALAAIAVGIELDIPFTAIKKALGEFRGIQRRFQVREAKNGMSWIDDYAHHPTEIKMTLKAARELCPARMVVVFQPHRYSRTQALYNEFLTAFYDADVLIITDIYAAGEAPRPGVSGLHLQEGIKEYGHKDVHFIADLKQTEQYIVQILEPGDVVLTLGAGDIWKVGAHVMKHMKTKR